MDKNNLIRAIFIGKIHNCLFYGMTGFISQYSTEVLGLTETWFLSDSGNEWFYVDKEDIYIPKF